MADFRARGFHIIDNKLLNMFPCDSKNDILNSRPTALEVVAKQPISESVHVIKMPHFAHLTLRQLGPLGIFAGLVTTLGNHVLSIVMVRSDKKVRRTNAGWVIALVQGVHALRNWTIGHDPRKPMSRDSTVWPTGIFQPSIVCSVTREWPLDTLLRILGLFSEKISHRLKAVYSTQMYRPYAPQIAAPFADYILLLQRATGNYPSQTTNYRCSKFWSSKARYRSIPLDARKRFPWLRLIVGAAGINDVLQFLKVGKLSHRRFAHLQGATARPLAVLGSAGPSLFYPAEVV
jgi:hypothetical protein